MNTFVEPAQLTSSIDGFINSGAAVGLLVIFLGLVAIIEKNILKKKSQAIKNMEHICEDEVLDIVEDIFSPDEIESITVSKLSEVLNADNVEKHGMPEDYALKMNFVYTDKSILDDYSSYQFDINYKFGKILSIFFQNKKIAYIELNAKTIFSNENDINSISLENAISLVASKNNFKEDDLKRLSNIDNENVYKQIFENCELYFVNHKLKIRKKAIDESEIKYDSRFVEKVQ